MAEVRGVNFGNKGAQLMLTAIVRHFADVPGVELAADHNVGSYIERASLGLYQKIWFQRFGGWPAYLLPGKLRSVYGLVAESEIDAVLDASGFAYSDQWGPRRCDYLARLSLRWKSRGRKLILLPQAFGPFERRDTAEPFRRILANADLVFVRDRVSMEHIDRLKADTSCVRMAPDFTNQVEGEVPHYFELRPGRAAIVPNTRMIDKRPSDARASYLPFLTRCALELRARALEPFVLLHETGDGELARKLVDALTDPIEVVGEPDPVKLKGILGACAVVVGSRFHALVGALSQGVPCLAAGWSHKYRTLLEDYGCPECLISPDCSDQELRAALAMVTEGRASLIPAIESARARLAQATRDMWAQVHEVLGCGNASSSL